MTKPHNLLYVGGIVRDGTPLWSILRAFEDVRAVDVEVRSVVTPEQKAAATALVETQQPKPKPNGSALKGENQNRVLDAMEQNKPTDTKTAADKSGLTRKQANMALYNLVKSGLVKRTGPGEYVKVTP